MINIGKLARGSLNVIIVLKSKYLQTADTAIIFSKKSIMLVVLAKLAAIVSVIGRSL